MQQHIEYVYKKGYFSRYVFIIKNVKHKFPTNAFLCYYHMCNNAIQKSYKIRRNIDK